MENNIAILEALVEMTSFTAEQKRQLSELLEQYGIDKPTKKSCPNCWRDAAILALRKAKGDKPIDPTLPRLRGNSADGVIFKGRLVSNANMTRELADWMEANGFPKQLIEQPK